MKAVMKTSRRAWETLMWRRSQPWLLTDRQHWMFRIHALLVGTHIKPLIIPSAAFGQPDSALQQSWACCHGMLT